MSRRGKRLPQPIRVAFSAPTFSGPEDFADTCAPLVAQKIRCRHLASAASLHALCRQVAVRDRSGCLILLSRSEQRLFQWASRRANSAQECAEARPSGAVGAPGRAAALGLIG